MEKFRLIFLLYPFLCPHLATAHAVITQNSLPIAPLVAHQANHITLRFNSAVEANLAQFFLVSAGEKQEKLSVKAGTNAGEIIISLPALEKGKYALKFKIFAADSHLTEDVLYFLVK